MDLHGEDLDLDSGGKDLDLDLNFEDLTTSLRFTHISGHSSAEGRACDRESSPTKTDVLGTVRRM